MLVELKPEGQALPCLNAHGDMLVGQLKFYIALNMTAEGLQVWVWGLQINSSN